ncbi:Echinoderm microtubule-associated protein-like 6 [Oopsacas minuta]|uniref:Echinoderm microtubule-associated protein-like 6 n=1 Tax=Oopsacas minuta TaxID=111878 RepID=A0AAV7JHI7_9METZ|nr:Echinoderm microtubule-associated protein-like 6 [Oopsacas minuta]
MDFSCDGTMLASIGLDDDHTILLHYWKSGQLLASVVGHKDRIFMIRWNPYQDGQLVTVGVKHLKFWNRVGSTMKSNRGILPKDKKNTTLLSIAFSQEKIPKDNESNVSEQFLFTGGSDGNFIFHALCTIIP